MKVALKMVPVILALVLGAIVLPSTSYSACQDIAFVYSDATDAGSYKALLDANGYPTTLIPMNGVATTDFSSYGTIIIGHGTGNLNTWGDSNSVAQIDNSGKPLIGLGEGGYAFFGKLLIELGWPNGMHGSQAGLNVVDTSSPIFNSPNNISIPASNDISIYSTSSPLVGIYFLPVPAGITVFGRFSSQSTHYMLSQQESRYLAWGFDDSPVSMTQTGRDLFINVVAYMAGCNDVDDVGQVPTLSEWGTIILGTLFTALLILIGRQSDFMGKRII
jgi:hypothetical protein